MKKVILTIIFAVAILVAKAQNNLQFNSIKLVSTVQTVPANKVWKVESCSFAGGFPFCVGTSSTSYFCGASSTNSSGTDAIMSYIVNGVTSYIIGITHHASYPSSMPNLSFPLWLPAGATLQAGTNMSYFSVMEFNVVP